MENFLILLLVSLLTYVDAGARALTLEAQGGGEGTAEATRHINIQSVAQSSGMAKETARRKVARLVDEG